jgi:gliding motility-associated-like protein
MYMASRGDSMIQNYLIYRFTLLILAAFFLNSNQANGQCPDPRLYDLNYTAATNNPVWGNCIDNSILPDQFVLPLLSPVDIHNYVLDFGDGSTPLTGALWPANTPINHTYDLGTYIITLSETQNGCTQTIQGRLINDRKPGATAMPPTIGTTGCVPHTLTFVNQSTNTSSFTTFEWNWGDGTVERVGANTAGQPISHTYEKGRAGCNMVVSLTAYGLCDTTFSSYGPYDFWDIDTAVVAASATRICLGQEITFTDQTLYNCNVRQPRRIRWNFSELGGPITDWLPATPANRSQTYFVSGNIGDKFTVFMEDSNYCGVDPTSVTVEIIAPPTAGINLPNPSICTGQEGVFLNTSSGGDYFSWDFGDGSTPVVVATRSEIRHTYNSPGTYTVKQVASLGGSQYCKDSTTVTIEVLPSSISDFTASVYSGCSPLELEFEDNSSNANSWNWDFGNGNTFSGANPITQIYTQPGTYIAELNTSNSLGCGSKKTATISVFPSVVSNPEGDSVCLGNAIEFLDKSFLLDASSCATGNILYEKWNNISGSSVNNLTSSSNFPSNPTSSALLNSFEAPINNGDNFGARIHGYICPPQSGNYLFWIASDDNSELWLSTNADPANAVRIASVNEYTNSREWTKYSSQQSLPIFLEAGKRYYIRALHKDGSGGDHLAVGWQLPSGTRERPIPGSRLAPFSEGGTIISRLWDFGNGLTSNLPNPEYIYPQEGEYTVTLNVSTGKCSATGDVKVRVFPTVSSEIWQSDTASCSPLNLEVTDLAIGATTLIWNFGDATPDNKYNVGEKDTITHQFVNTSGVNRDFYISLIALNEFGCSDTAFSKVKVFPAPKADFSFTPGVPQCSPALVNFVNASEASDSYKWYFGTSDSVSTSTLGQVAHSFINQSQTVVNNSVKLKAYSNNGCYGEVEKFVTVYPKPNFEIIADPDTACHPAKIKLSVTGNPVQSLWSLGDGSMSTFPSLVKEYFNTSSVDSSYSIQFIGSSAFNCKDTVQTTVLIQPKPTADFIANINSGCSPLTVDFENLSQGGIYSIFTYGDGDIDTINLATHSHIFRNSGNTAKEYEVILKVINSAGCFDERKVTITVFPEIQVGISPSVLQGCSPLQVSFENNSTGASIYQWSFGDGSSSNLFAPTHTFTNSTKNDTVYNVSMLAISSFGCQESDSLEITVFSNPVANFITDITSGCSPLKVNFENLSQGGIYSIFTYGDGDIDTINLATHSHIFRNSGNTAKEYEVILKVINSAGCFDEKKVTITVFPEIQVGISPSVLQGCSPLQVSFENTSTGASIYQWSFGDGSSSNLFAPTHTFTNSSQNDTIYKVSILAISSFGCQKTDSLEITVFSNPVANFVSDITSGCSPLNINFVNLAQNADSTVWNFGDGVSRSDLGNTPVFLYKNTDFIPKDYTVTQTVFTEKLCKSSLSLKITVNPEVIALLASSDTAGCTPWNVNFYNTSVGASSYLWDFGDLQNSIQKSPAHIFVNESNISDSVYSVSLVAINAWSCKDTVTQQIKVFPKPKADYLIANPIGCSPHEVIFTNNSIGATSYFWDFGNGTSDTLSTNVFEVEMQNTEQVTKIYPVRLRAENDFGCTSTLTKDVTIYPKVLAQFESDPSGCTPFHVALKNTTQGGSTYFWQMGDGQTSTEFSPTHTYLHITTADTIFNIKLIATSTFGCTDTIQRQVKVFSKPVASFIASPKTLQLPDSVVHISNTSSIGDWQYKWEFGDGEVSTLKHPNVHYYNFYGTYKIKLIVSGDNCLDSVSQFITVLPTKPIAAFAGQGEGCSPVSVQFTNQTKYADRYEWEFGDGQTSFQKNPKHVYDFPGEYSVILRVFGEGGTDMTIHKDVVKVYSIPSSFFQVKPDDKEVKVGNAHYFSNLSDGATTFHWNFGDGSTSSERSPFHEYRYPGVYDVTLVVSNENGCSDEHHIKSAAIVAEGGKILVPNAFTPSGGGNILSAGMNDYFNPLAEGIVEFHMQIFNRWGELLFETNALEPGWDGTYRGKLCKQDVYVYKIKAKFIDGETIEKIGDVTLIR